MSQKPFSSYITPPSRLTNFQKVVEFNKAFGVQTNTTPQLDIFDKDPKFVESRLALIREEFSETVEAIKNKDFTEMTDGLVDLLVVTYGMCANLGIPADKCFEIVNQSNLSKLCETEEDAQETVKRYKTEVPQRYDSPAYRKSDDGIHWVVYNQSTMKILKNYKYTPANFTELLELDQHYKQLTGTDKITWRPINGTVKEFDPVKNKNPELLLKVKNGDITIDEYINSF